jgi:2,3-bisphosphoglycerate-dependent phosphoglycerate mutase
MQARVIARKLKGKKIDAAYTSDLSRCKNTLKEVLIYHRECKKTIIDKRLRERSYGKLQGMSHKSFIDKYGIEKFKIYHRSYDVSPPGGESVKMVEKRVYAFIKDMLEYVKKNKVDVAVSASGNSMRPFRRYFEKASVEKMMSWEMPWDDYFEYSVKI